MTVGVPRIMSEDFPQPSQPFLLGLTGELIEIAMRGHKVLLHERRSIALRFRPALESRSGNQPHRASTSREQPVPRNSTPLPNLGQTVAKLKGCDIERRHGNQ